MFVAAIAKEMRLKRDNVADPVKFLSNIAVHLSGPSRTPGAVIVGSSGVRIFTPKPISTLLSSVGGTNVMLGLIAMATTAECLYASVKALVCTVGGNSVALKDMEKSGSFKVSGMSCGKIKGKLYSSTVYIQMYNIYYNCSCVLCMHVQLPAHMYMHIHSQTTHITLCILLYSSL